MDRRIQVATYDKGNYSYMKLVAHPRNYFTGPRGATNVIAKAVTEMCAQGWEVQSYSYKYTATLKKQKV